MTRGKAMLRAAEVELDRQNPNWRLEDLERTLPPLGENENLAPKLLAIAKKFPPGWESETEPSDVQRGARTVRVVPPPNFAITDAERTFLNSRLIFIEDEVIAIRKLPALPRGKMPIDYSPDYIATSAPHLSQYQMLAMALKFDARSRADGRDLAGAMESATSVLRVCKAMTDEFHTGSQTCRTNLRRLAMNLVQHVVNAGACKAASLEQLAQLIKEECEANELRLALMAERAGYHSMFKNIEDGAVDKTTLLMLNAQAKQLIRTQAPDEIASGRIRGTAMWHYLHMHGPQAKFLRDLTHLLDHSDADYQKINQVVAEQKVLSEKDDLFPGILSRTYKLIEDRHHTLARARCAEVALAAERFRQKHGRWPTTQAELVPGFLKKAVVDPFDTTQPIAIRPTVDGFVAYSVGPKKDNSGTYYDAGTTPATNGLSRELLEFRLWNPSHRRVSRVG